MPTSYTLAKRRSNERYEKSKLDHVHLRLKKGQRAAVQNHAAARGESLNGFISRAIDETIERDNMSE